MKSKNEKENRTLPNTAPWRTLSALPTRIKALAWQFRRETERQWRHLCYLEHVNSWASKEIWVYAPPRCIAIPRSKSTWHSQSQSKHRLVKKALWYVGWCAITWPPCGRIRAHLFRNSGVFAKQQRKLLFFFSSVSVARCRNNVHKANKADTAQQLTASMNTPFMDGWRVRHRILRQNKICGWQETEQWEKGGGLGKVKVCR